MLKVKHDGTPPGEVQENCCLCRAKTRYWHSSDVALCETCAKTATLKDLPTKAAWCAKEKSIFRLARTTT